MKNVFNRAVQMLLFILTIALPSFAGTGSSHGQNLQQYLYPVFGFGLVVNGANLAALFKSFKTIFNEAMAAVTPQYEKIAIVVPSSTKSESYSWLGAFPKMREWIGDRNVKNLQAYQYAISNKDFESTVAIPRNDIEDDQYGVYKPVFAAMGSAAKIHPDELVFGLLNGGFTGLAYDGKAFFSTTHSFGSNKGTAALTPTSFGAAIAAIRSIKDEAGKPLFSGNERLTLVTGPTLEGTARNILNSDFISVTGGSAQNNVWKGSADYLMSSQITSTTAWFITVEFNGLKPFIFQNRKSPEFIAKQNPEQSDSVFMQKTYLYGVDSRDNAGYGLPQLCYGSDGTT